MTVDLSKLHGPALPMKFKVVITGECPFMKTGSIVEAEGICVDVSTGLVHVCPNNGDRFSFRIDEVEVIQSIGRSDNSGAEVFMGDVLEFDQAGFLSSDRACVRWDILGQNLRLLTRTGTTHPLSNCENGRILGNHFSDKTLMEPKPEESHV